MLSPGAVAAVAIAAIGSLAIAAVAAVCVLQARRVIAVRKQRARARGLAPTTMSAVKI